MSNQSPDMTRIPAFQEQTGQQMGNRAFVQWIGQPSPMLGVLQARGFRVALLTGGRMSGASGKVLAAIQVTPEAADGGALARIQNGDLVSIDATRGSLDLKPGGELMGAHTVRHYDNTLSGAGVGRELFTCFRANTGSAEEGASIFPYASLKEHP